VAAVSAPAPEEPPRAAPCREQSPQEFLVRRSYTKSGGLDPVTHGLALSYRARTYGHVATPETEPWNESSAEANIVEARFLNFKVPMHRMVVPALACVEQHIRKECGLRYHPRDVLGWRAINTFRGGEISNHLFGIAIDIDPKDNPCCHCVAPWREHPLCTAEVKSVYQRTIMPRCFIAAFERYGFYWLGRDRLMDTMHFEYLGDPRELWERPPAPLAAKAR
jgi:hypothetical protein